MTPNFLRRLHLWMAGESNQEKLPTRVRDAIKQQQEASEIVIGWVQLCIVSAFGVLYAVAPKTFTDEADFAPVPWALGIYLIFTLIRIWLAYRRHLPFWMLVVSVIVDMLLLLALIWSFHLQYEQPPSFYLKAPTLLYVFIFIVLRSLRFEAGFVVLSGIVAAGGWLLMVFYAVMVESGEQMITRNYVEYLTSNKVLLGAEFDKVISILVVTIVLTVAIMRAQRLLVRSVVGSTAAQDLSRFVPDEVARRITSSDERIDLGQGEVREATILFADIANFTTIGEQLAPEQLINTLNEYFAVVAQPIERFHGVICQFQGDAILASFNLPEAHPDHASNAVNAAIEIQQLLVDRTFGSGINLRSRIGINSGLVVGGLVGTPDRLGYTIHGDDVNLSARLEQLNKEHKTSILISEHTCELAGWDNFTFKFIQEVTVRGRHETVKIYTVDH
ncbi:adenylate/guanylate cyclase domain-containing protein [Pseudomonadota bacterium]